MGLIYVAMGMTLANSLLIHAMAHYYLLYKVSLITVESEVQRSLLKSILEVNIFVS